MTAPEPEPALRDRVLAAAYECVARFGIAKTTVEDVVKQSGVSRATVYRVFPGGKEQLLRAAVGWEMDRFFLRLAEEVVAAPDFASMVECGLTFAHSAVHGHEVLQKVLVTEPERILPLLTTEQERPAVGIPCPACHRVVNNGSPDEHEDNAGKHASTVSSSSDSKGRTNCQVSYASSLFFEQRHT